MLEDKTRALLYGCGVLLAFALIGTRKLWDLGGIGALVWLALIGAARLRLRDGLPDVARVLSARGTAARRPARGVCPRRPRTAPRLHDGRAPFRLCAAP